MMQLETLGSYNFNVLRCILETYNFLQVGAGVEVGVFDGGTSWYLLNYFPHLKLFSVDPYQLYNEYDADRLAQAERTAAERLTPFGDRSVRVKLPSVEAAKHFDDNSIDFVFIDADHSYQGAKQDIEAWYPKVRSRGLFSGHDYRWQGVERAVKEFADAKKLSGFFSPAESDMWWFVKP